MNNPPSQADDAGGTEAPRPRNSWKAFRMSPADIRTVVVLAALSLTLADVDPIPVTFPSNDFVMYYDVATGVDRSPYLYPDEYSVWLYTPPAKSMFQFLFSFFPHYQDAHRFWLGLNMMAIIGVLLVNARRGWAEIALLVPVLREGLGLWAGGNIAPILSVISLTPLGAIVACGFKPYFILFVLVHYADRLRRRSTWVALAASAFLASYSVLGLTEDQRSWIIQNRLLARDYLYVIGVLVSLVVTRHGRTFISLVRLPSFTRRQPGQAGPPGEI
jgi:hypothetical protein